MGQVAIVADTVSCIPPNFLQEYRIHSVPVKLVLNGRVYSDGVDLSADQAYQLLREARLATMSAPSPGDFLLTYRQAAQEAPQVLCLTVSSQLSATYQAALRARDQAREEMPRVTIEVLDTASATAAEGFVVLAAARAAAEGKDLAEIIRAAEEVRGRVQALILLDTLRYLHRSGRVPHLFSQMGTLLAVRPILALAGGHLRPVTAVRSRTRGIERLLALAKERVGDRPVHMAVMHAAAPEEAQALKERVEREFHIQELLMTHFTPVMGYATGPGVLGLAFYIED